MDLLSGNECNARQGKCCKKNGQKKHGEHSSILTIPKVFVRNWLDRVENYFDKTALGDHSYVETRSDRIQNTKQLGTQIESRRCSTTTKSTTDFCSSKTRMQKNARRTCEKTQQECRPIRCDQQVRQRRGQAFEGIDEYDYRVDPRTGWQFHNSESQGDLSPSSSSSNWDRNKWTTRSWNPWHSSRSENS